MCGGCCGGSSGGMDRKEFLKIGGAGVFGAAMLGLTLSGQAMAQTNSSLVSEFEDASEKYGVPLELLLAMGYVSTRWTMPEVSGGYRPGDIHGMGGYGVMALSDNPDNETLARAADLTNIPQDKLQNDRASNILGAAAVLSELHKSSGANPDDLDSWYDVASTYGDGPLYANQVFQTLKDGVSGEAGEEELGFEAQDVEDPRPLYSTAETSDYSGASWYGAYSGNYSSTNRPSSNKITKIVIHVMQGSWSSAINWFKDSRAGVSCHYNIRSSDGFIGQSVKERDIAYQAGHWPTNQTSVGIEHEGYVSDPGRWFTDAMYRSSAKLTAYLCKKYGIAINRTNIIAHAEVPGCSGTGGGSGCHTDPGSGWDWNRYINLVKEFAGGQTNQASNPNDVIVDNATAGRFTASSEWDRNTFNTQRYGPNYCAGSPSKSVIDPARFKVNIPVRGTYKVYARWPAASGYNTRTTFRIRTSGGLKERVVNQTRNGGKWVLLGSYPFAAKDAWIVHVSRKSQRAGYVIADAGRFIKS
ncbi:MAG: N-acetylmuramoyl-L-alanine amidase [Rubrobacter sp.]